MLNIDDDKDPIWQNLLLIFEIFLRFPHSDRLADHYSVRQKSDRIDWMIACKSA